MELDGAGNSSANTGIGFMNHMFDHLARHGMFDLTVEARGDLDVDLHHTVEDLGICLGKAFSDALGGREGITRFGHAVVPMDEALAEAAVDFSGRPYLEFNAEFKHGRVGDFDVELIREFFQAFSVHGGATLHVILREGENVHHAIEAVFKAFARATAVAVKVDPDVEGVPSTKGTLDT